MTDRDQVLVYGADWCRDFRRTRQQLTELDVDFDCIDTDADAQAAQRAQQISDSTKIPVVVYPDGGHQVEPSNDEVEEKLRGLSII
ncbi:glutaredoxin domain-containing protein [Garicola koreensis]|uniref:Glutaredoxin n=1 Tax=Garicola koreensis TaxID=1262554 RepID=A0A7W5TRN8_9MICC|nr:glutaredoxin domain-containing protein [Garicola koreensis]MBB3666468.1 glutaredoxin [Garicola koreensis]